MHFNDELFSINELKILINITWIKEPMYHMHRSIIFITKTLYFHQSKNSITNNLVIYTQLLLHSVIDSS